MQRKPGLCKIFLHKKPLRKLPNLWIRTQKDIKLKKVKDLQCTVILTRGVRGAPTEDAVPFTKENDDDDDTESKLWVAKQARYHRLPDSRTGN